ncbi:hypothetical protein CDAR_56271 [Caerostris darwini]|uniref:Uncharacterized protein n=1 Tax=Caerostris darwini TaxID=1538125 RepID=A0AAV4WKA7_9ARAC|nr:hypothetical protein CDAR_56271 [Caerostris darwini]
MKVGLKGWGARRYRATAAQSVFEIPYPPRSANPRGSISVDFQNGISMLRDCSRMSRCLPATKIRFLLHKLTPDFRAEASNSRKRWISILSIRAVFAFSVLTYPNRRKPR